MCSNCTGDYEDPDRNQSEPESDPEPMTFDRAHKLHLDVFSFAHNARASRTAYAAGTRAQGRETTEFEEIVAGFKLLCLAVGPRPDSGNIARSMKRRKHGDS